MKRIFIAFAVEDARMRDFLVGQSKNEKAPFEFVDMSVKQPWDTDWKTKCRSRIKGCDGVIALISNRTSQATGQIFEINTAYEEGVPTMLMYINNDRPSLPSSLSGKLINVWSWDNLKAFLNRL